jgi:hypothetical protein
VLQLLPSQNSITPELYLIVPALELLQVEDTEPILIPALALIPPETSSLAEGEVVPMPTLPISLITK